MPLLADLPSPPNAAVGTWIAIYAALIVAAYYTIVFVQKISGRKDKFGGHSNGSVSREELKQVHGRIERERREINLEIQRIERDAKERMDALDENLRTNTTLTSEMNGLVKHMDGQLQNLNRALTEFLSGRRTR